LTTAAEITRPGGRARARRRRGGRGSTTRQTRPGVRASSTAAGRGSTTADEAGIDDEAGLGDDKDELGCGGADGMRRDGARDRR